jgi:hypothetical protein
MPNVSYAKEHVKVADELFIILALLHRENPHKEAFTIGEVIERARAEGLGAEEGSLRAHASGHAAANRPPGRNGKYRIAYVQEDKRVRLLRGSDYVHPDRHHKFYPEPGEIPKRYHELLEWAKQRREPSSVAASGTSGWLSGLRELRGLGKELWKGVDPDRYVRDLREGWE